MAVLSPHDGRTRQFSAFVIRSHRATTMGTTPISLAIDRLSHAIVA